MPHGSSADREESAPPKGGPARNLDLAQIFNLIELGDIVWFVPESLARLHPRPGVAYRSVGDLPPLEFALAWPQESRSPAVAAFVRTACAVAALVEPQADSAQAALRQVV